MKTFLFLSGFQWFGINLVVLVLMLLADAFAGHYRSGFKRKIQFAPFVFGGVLILFLIAAIVFPESNAQLFWLHFAAWLCVAGGALGFIAHLYYGIGRGPKGAGWVLHHMMYGPPLLAAPGLSAAGLFTVLMISHRHHLIFLLVSVSILGTIIQTFFLHFRGAFNNPLMYLPFVFPIGTVFFLILTIFFSGGWISHATEILLWITFLTGFIGLGMHLRGMDRQRGGLYVPVFNLMEGPPLFAPGLYAAFASIGLVEIYLL